MAGFLHFRHSHPGPGYCPNGHCLQDITYDLVLFAEIEIVYCITFLSEQLHYPFDYVILLPQLPHTEPSILGVNPAIHYLHSLICLYLVSGVKTKPSMHLQLLPSELVT